MVGETEDAMYVAFVGTKKLRDLLTDLNFWQAPLPTSKVDSGAPARKTKRPLVHQGFLSRAEAIPTRELFKTAQQRNKRLVFCGTLLGCNRWRSVTHQAY
jgi:hypothetical protein